MQGFLLEPPPRIELGTYGLRYHRSANWAKAATILISTGAVSRNRTGDLFLRLHLYFNYTQLRGLDCIFGMFRKAKRSLPCQSFGRLLQNATVLACVGLLTVIRVTIHNFLCRGQGSLATHHGNALPAELKRLILLFNYLYREHISFLMLSTKTAKTAYSSV